MECSSAGWDCTVLGVLSAGTTVAIAYFLVKMVTTYLVTRQYAFETIMVALAGCQTLVSSIHFLVHHDPSLEFTVKFFRSLLITFSLTNTMSPLLTEWPRASSALLPGTVCVVVYLVILYIVALASVDLDCSHPTWMIMSISDAMLAMSFGVLGLCVLRALKRAHSKSGEHSSSYFALKTTQLRILASVNSTSSVLQLCIDLSVGLSYTIAKGCNLVADQTTGVILLLIVLRILSYAIPVWVIVFTFYWLPRRQYSTDMDLQLDSITSDLAGGYALMGALGGAEGDDAGVGGLAASLDRRRSSGGAEAMLDAL